MDAQISKHECKDRDLTMYRLFRPAAIAIARWMYRFQRHPVQPKADTYLVYSNHVTFLDPALLAADFPRPMYFVASEHLLRRKGVKLAAKAFNPIIRVKARTETAAAMNILRCLRKGKSVCVFIEGERSMDGVTVPPAANAAHLAQLSGCALVTYRLHGGYLTDPRWSNGLRKGRVYGEAVHEYSAEELQRIPREELQAQIAADLLVDAYADQDKEPVAYRGRTPAENLEVALCLCPRCGGMDKLHSQGDRFYCDCGLELRYDEYGFFRAADGEPPFPTVREWFVWQRGKLEELARNFQGEQPIFVNTGQTLIRPGIDRKTSEVTLSMYRDRLTLEYSDGGKLDIPFAETHDLCCHDRMRISLIHDNILYEINSPYTHCSIRYQIAFHAFRARKTDAEQV